MIEIVSLQERLSLFISSSVFRPTLKSFVQIRAIRGRQRYLAGVMFGGLVVGYADEQKIVFICFKGLGAARIEGLKD